MKLKNSSEQSSRGNGPNVGIRDLVKTRAAVHDQTGEPLFPIRSASSLIGLQSGAASDCRALISLPKMPWLVTSLRIPTNSGHLFRSIPAILQGDERNAGQFNQTPLLLPHSLPKLQGEIQNSQALPIPKPIPSPPIPGERAGCGGILTALFMQRLGYLGDSFQ